MKKDIHPKYYKVTATCACGNSFETGSTRKEIKTELCSACHPFYTGKQKLVDTARRVEKFTAKVKAKDEAGKDKKGKTAKRAAKAEAKAKKEVTVKPGTPRVVSKKKSAKAKTAIEKKVVQPALKTTKKSKQ